MLSPLRQPRERSRNKDERAWNRTQVLLHQGRALTDCAILAPAIDNVGTQALNQLSTKIRPKKKYKTNRKDLDGGAIDIQKHLSKLGELHSTSKKYNYGPGTKLEERLNSNDSSICEPINRLDAICKQRDIAYSKAGDNLSRKYEADNVMIKQIGDIPVSQRPQSETKMKR